MNGTLGYGVANARISGTTSLTGDFTTSISAGRVRDIWGDSFTVTSASLPAGTSLSEERILAVLDDRQPRRAGELRQLTVSATLREGADLGLLGAGAVRFDGIIVV